MKLRNVLKICPAVLAFSIVAAGAQPLARISIGSFGSLSNAIIRVAGAAYPGLETELGAQLTRHLGLTNTATFDAKGPWEIAVWQHAESPDLLVAVKGPIADVKKFQRELTPQGILSALGKDWIQLGHGTAAIVFKASDKQSDAEKAGLKQWEDEAMAAPHRAVQLTLAPSEATRARVLPLLETARISMQKGAAAAASGMNQKAMGDLFGLYFDAIDAFVKGFQDLKLAVDVTPESIVVEESISAIPGSQFAKWIHKPANPVLAEDLEGLDPSALGSAAMTIGKDPLLMDLMRKFVLLSLQMQNQSTNGGAADDLADLMAKCLPARVSGSFFLKGHMQFSGMYRFPESAAAAVYAQMKPVMKRLIATQAGEGKMYSAATLAENHHAVAGTPVDRYSFTVNMDNPAFKQPGQQEQIKALMPNGQLVFDYAVKNNRLMVASPDLMAALIEGAAKPDARRAIVPDDSTVAAGYFNLLSAIRDFSSANPMIPDAIKDKMANLDPSGTAIRFQLKMNSQVRWDVNVPLKLIEQLGHLK